MTLALLVLLAQAPADPLLSRLEGRWTASGTIRGKSVVYDAHGAWVLGNGFFLLTLKDSAVPSRYEAQIFLGRSKEKGDYVAHWLDGFGADGARVVGTGAADGGVLDLTFPYDSGPFLDRFELLPDGSFTLTIDSKKKDGTIARFARYTFTRVAKDGGP